jgi:glucans biosynthesis protein
MSHLSRRAILTSLVASATFPARAGVDAAEPTRAAAASVPQQPKFAFDDVVRRARDLAGASFESVLPALPDALTKLDFDAWRDIRFRSEKAFLGGNGTKFRLQLFHLGHLYPRPVTINTVRDGIATPIPYSASLFDYGRTKLDKPLPVNLGFAGFRLHYPLNTPRVYDEVVAFLGSSYFRLLGRGQRYGSSARALAVEAGTEHEEFPFFREFWVETPDTASDHATIYALLDSRSTTGAFRFDLYPGVNTVLEVAGTLVPRRSDAKLGLAPLTSMFFLGENDHRFDTDFRRELHDSDGLLIHSGTGEWIWRPLRNPVRPEISTFLDTDNRGFGLVQRDRDFDAYQDLDLAYETRPSYFVEPRDSFGEGRIELVELPTDNETNDNIVASFVPKDPPEAMKLFTYAYKVTASLDVARLSPNGRVLHTYQTKAASLGSPEPTIPGSRRFIIDFAGGDLAYFAGDPELVEVVPSTSSGKILRSFIVPNPHIGGFRAAIDVQLELGRSTDVRAFLRSGSRALTETWTFPWRAD